MSVFVRLLAQGFHLADKVVPQSLLSSTAPADLIRAARATPGPQAREGLERLIASIATDSDLCVFGKLSLRWDSIRLLRNAQKVEDAHHANPALGAAPITAPVFILGLPRSGTTFLHGLMAEDEENLVPRNWQTIYPGPRPAGFNPAQDQRVKNVDRQLRLFAGLAPGFEEMHPINADSPQECSEITAHVFQSLRFDSTHRVPGYFHWLEAHGHDDAFRFHKLFLQYLQNGTPSRWVLKCPDHTFTLDSLLKTYPDARFVIVHRDPIAVLGSVAHLTEVLRRPFLKNIDAAEIGAQVAERWTHGANLLLEFDQRADVPAERKIHVHYDELIAAPLAIIERIYGQFGMALGEAGQAAMAVRLKARPRGGYGKHAPYRLENFKLSVPALRTQFAPYVRQFCGGAD
ncbi:MAG: sulfotransferase [Acidocella sp.]|nr:sulfotransferase [Acidocella sp.]